VVREEEELEEVCHQLAEQVAPLHRLLAPDSFNNMTLFEEAAVDCRLGRQPGRPYSGITTVVDFCAHSHRDTTNMVGGCTAILTLTKPENRNGGTGPSSSPEDEQFHTLPMYVPDLGEAELSEAEGADGITILDRFHKKVVLGQTESSCKKRGTPKRKAAAMTAAAESDGSPRKQPALIDYPYAGPQHERQSFASQLFFPGSSDGSAFPLAVPLLPPPGSAAPPTFFLTPLVDLQEGDVEDSAISGIDVKTESPRVTNLQIYESDCQEAFRYDFLPISNRTS
jgi:hypothetical protein